MEKNNKTQLHDIWRKYEQIKEQHILENIDENVKMCFRFYEGDQWYGVEKSGERLPKYNFIKPTVDYKVAMVAKNNLDIVYSPMDDNDRIKNEIYSGVCENFNQFAKSKWEKTKMDSKLWEVAKNSCISGDSYLFFYNSNMDSQVINKENMYFADESLGDIQKQPYIIIFERRSVEAVREEALKNGVEKEKVNLIVSDDDENEDIYDRLKNDNSICTSLLYMYKKNGVVHYLKAVRNLIYSPECAIEGMKLYPIASYIWLKKYNSSRGVGEVYEMIPNQISANALLVRREINNKMTGYAKPVYNSDYIENPESISKIGTSIKVSGPAAANIADVFGYISPAPMNSEAKQLQDEILNVSQQLGGAGSLITNSLDPEKTSGSAIVAAQEQASIPLGENSAFFRQFVEDVAKIWLNMWIVYNPEGMKLEYEKDGKKMSYVIPQHILLKMQFNVRIDISPVNPFSKYAREQSLEKALDKNHITFEEFVEMLDDNSTVPKGKFSDVIKKRTMSGASAEDDFERRLKEVKL